MFIFSAIKNPILSRCKMTSTIPYSWEMQLFSNQRVFFVPQRKGKSHRFVMTKLSTMKELKFFHFNILITTLSYILSKTRSLRY